LLTNLITTIIGDVTSLWLLFIIFIVEILRSHGNER
jgi:hypothetical protein